MAGKPTYAGRISNHGTQIVEAPIKPAGKNIAPKSKSGDDLRTGKK